jgi:RNA recognition motif-containing protein
MNTKLYFDNLPGAVTEQELTDLFSAYGNIVKVHIATDRAGFVTMITPEGAQAAMQALDGKVLGSGVLALSEVWPMVEPVQLTNSPTGPRRRTSYLY